MSHEYAVGSRCWQPDAADGWVASTVKHKTVDGDKVTLVFAYDERDDVPTPEVCTLLGPRQMDIGESMGIVLIAAGQNH